MDERKNETGEKKHDQDCYERPYRSSSVTIHEYSTVKQKNDDFWEGYRSHVEYFNPCLKLQKLDDRLWVIQEIVGNVSASSKSKCYCSP